MIYVEMYIILVRRVSLLKNKDPNVILALDMFGFDRLKYLLTMSQPRCINLLK